MGKPVCENVAKSFGIIEYPKTGDFVMVSVLTTLGIDVIWVGCPCSGEHCNMYFPGPKHESVLN